ncbi:hypothetical protein KFK09_024772 [Dendrobium nobile]|uniref:Ribosomal protein L34e superfamily protein n=1 Tax=Dendrobium nobile TaxID=94219 RepID=A0A8T3AEY8_DENNO|nr:hypothetical protein KFK09_024772 [Dendrobium nobile]
MRAASPPATGAVWTQTPRSHKKKAQVNSQNPIKTPPCPNKKSAIANISILVAVLFACGFLLFPCLKFFSNGFSDFWKKTVITVDNELGIANGFYWVSGFGFTIACSILLWIFSCCVGKKCDNPNCRGLRNATEFDIKIETEDCLKKLLNSPGGDGGDKGFFELGEDYNRELAAELKKMAPLNGRAVLIFRAKCGCSAGRLVVWGQKKTRKARNEEPTGRSEDSFPFNSELERKETNRGWISQPMKDSSKQSTSLEMSTKQNLSQ